MSDEKKSGPEKPEEYKEIFAASIPDLPLEDFEPDIETVEDEVEDEANGALTYAFVGAGQGGGRMAKAFFDLGYTKTLAVNTAKNDLNLLDLPEDHKFYIDHGGDQGAGKDQTKAAIAFESRELDIFNKFKSILLSRKHISRKTM